MSESGKAIASIEPNSGPTIRGVFQEELRRKHAALIAEARAVPADWADVRSDDAGRLARLVRRLADALEGKC